MSVAHALSGPSADAANPTLFSPYRLGELGLKSRMVMAPMTCSCIPAGGRATGILTGSIQYGKQRGSGAASPNRYRYSLPTCTTIKSHW